MIDAPVRKENRLADYDYTQNGVYFITVCTRGKTKLFWEGGDAVEGVPPLNEAGRTVRRFIERIPQVYPGVVLEKYIVMPNHVHLLVRVETGNTAAISTVINQLKGHITRAVGVSCWQKGFHDHIVRNDADYLRIWQYIDNNPLKWSLDCFYCE